MSEESPKTEKRRRHRTMRFLLSAAVVLLIVSVGTGFAFPRLRRRAVHRAKRTWWALSGGMVDVGTHRLRIECQGTGSPAVILESGLAQPMATWGSVPSEVAKFTTVCSYDRSGIGDSDRGPGPRTSQRMADELHLLLLAARITGPYVLVGHSFGALNVRVYANKFPDDVAGLVLLDPLTEDQTNRFAALLAPPLREDFLAKDINNFEKADITTSEDQVRAIMVPPAVPTIVLTARFESAMDGMNSPQTEQAWNEMQAQLAARFPKGKQILVKDSGHFIQQDQPDAVVKAIREVFSSTRHAANAFSDTEQKRIVGVKGTETGTRRVSGRKS